MEDLTNEKLIEQMHSGNEKAREILILKNQKFVRHVIKSLGLSNQLEDIFQVGMIGLIEAIDTYKIDKNTKLTTYSNICIRNRILQVFREPYNKRLKNITDSLSSPINDGVDIMLGDTILDEKQDVEEIIIDKLERQQLHEAIKMLKPDEQRLIYLFYFENLSHKQMAEIIGFSLGYVNKVLIMTRKKLKQILLSPSGCSSNEEIMVKEKLGLSEDIYKYLTIKEKELAELYFEKGLSQRKIAEIFSCTQSNVSRKLKKLKLRITEEKEKLANNEEIMIKEKFGLSKEIYKYLIEEETDLAELYFEKGLSQQKIAKILGCSQGTISNKLKKLKLKITEIKEKLADSIGITDTSEDKLYVPEHILSALTHDERYLVEFN